MMKLLLTYILIFSPILVKSQHTERVVAATSGNSISVAEITIAYTIGEPIVGYTANGTSVDQGFWAGYPTSEIVESYPEGDEVADEEETEVEEATEEEATEEEATEEDEVSSEEDAEGEEETAEEDMTDDTSVNEGESNDVQEQEDEESSEDLNGDEEITDGEAVASEAPEVETLSEIQIFPNPVEDFLTIIPNSKEIYGLTLFNVLGQRVLMTSTEIANTEHKISLSHLSKGVYILKISIKEEREKLFKILKN